MFRKKYNISTKIDLQGNEHANAIFNTMDTKGKIFIVLQSSHHGCLVRKIPLQGHDITDNSDTICLIITSDNKNLLIQLK